jgi:hypothetical protein
MYPNPTTGVVTIQLEAESGDVEMNIMDSKGSKIMTQTFDQAQTYQLDLADFVEGVYFIMISNDKGTSTDKLTIIH